MKQLRSTAALVAVLACSVPAKEVELRVVSRIHDPLTDRVTITIENPSSSTVYFYGFYLRLEREVTKEDRIMFLARGVTERFRGHRVREVVECKGEIAAHGTAAVTVESASKIPSTSDTYLGTGIRLAAWKEEIKRNMAPAILRAFPKDGRLVDIPEEILGRYYVAEGDGLSPTRTECAKLVEEFLEATADWQWIAPWPPSMDPKPKPKRRRSR